MEKINLCGLTLNEISGMIEAEGFSSENAITISNNLYKKKIRTFEDVRSLPVRLRKYLDEVSESGFYEPVSSQTSADKTVKYLFRNPEGNQFETVFIPDKKRNTVCVSAQSGCRMGCHFCMTGRYGFHGNLSAGDIVNQVLSLPGSEMVTHVVFMGMGEPLDNLPEVLKSCEIFTSQWGLAIGKANITVSTVGIMPAIAEFLAVSPCNLTLSLCSPFLSERMKFIPAEQKYPLNELMDMMKAFPVTKKRRLSIAYVMIRDFNDTDMHLEGLKQMLRGSGIRVNLLPYHRAADDINGPSSNERMNYFKHNLVLSGISASIRKSRGVDISAACGLLASGFLS